MVVDEGIAAPPPAAQPLAPAPPSRALLPRTVRDTLVDLVAMLIVVLMATLIAVSMGTGAEHQRFPLVVTTGWWVWVEAVVLLAGVVLIWGRRRHPRVLSLVFAVLSAVSISAGTVVLVFLFTVAVHRSARQLAGVTAVVIAGGTAFVALSPHSGTGMWVNALFSATGTLAVAGWGTAVRHRRQLVATLRERAERAETEQQLRVDQAKQLERTRIAREMHDVLAHRISLISMHAGALEYRRDASPEQVAEAAAVVRASAHQALEDLRSVLGVLRSDELPGPITTPAPRQPSLRDLPALVEESRRAGARVDLDLTGLAPAGHDAAVPAAGEVVPEVATALGRTVYRIVQEGLTNAYRHAPGSRVVVAVSGEEGGYLEVTVRNQRPVGQHADGVAGQDGGGIPTESTHRTGPRQQSGAGPGSGAGLGSGTGLIGLRERTELSGGRLSHGWIVNVHELRAVLPWPAR